MESTSRRRAAWLLACALPLAVGCATGSGDTADGSLGGGQEAGPLVDAARTSDGKGTRPDGGRDAGERTMEASTGIDASEPFADAKTSDARGGEGGGEHALDASPDDAHGLGHDGEVATHDSGVDAAKHPDAGAASDAGGAEAGFANACGICDRVWVCNGFADNWVSVGPTACADIRQGTAVATLYCSQADTINYADPNDNDGTWSFMGDELVLDYNSLEGTVEIDCYPE
jgi:hypothetical protein